MLANKVCLITGTSKGIGKSILEAFAAHDAVIFAHARNEGDLDEVLENLKNTKAEIIPVYFDVTDFDEVKSCILQIKKSYKRLDVLINNAGIITYEILGMINFTKFREMLEVNLVAPIYLMQMVAKLMQRQSSGSIINISSKVAVEGVKGQMSYSATKGGLNAATLSAAKELSAKQIRVNAIAPGMIGSERLKHVMDDKFSDKLNDIGFGRLGTPNEVADACLFLASDLSKYVTGQIIQVDGDLKL
ncbi:MAG: SDR family NAD(P)-dependent oxidoreductase [Psychroflexus salarius]